MSFRCCCGAIEGELHELGCEWESCVYCGGRVEDCGCHSSDLRDLSTRVPFIHIPCLCALCGADNSEMWMVPCEDKGHVPLWVENSVRVRSE